MQTPQKQPDIGVSSLSTLSLDPHRELKTLLYRFLSHPETDQRKALETHLAQNATTYLENPAMSRKTATLIGDFIQHPANQQQGNVPPTLHGLDQFNQAFQEIRHAVRPLSNQTEQRLTSGFQKLDRTVNSLAAGTFGPHSEQTIKKAAVNSVKIAYNITHQGIEAATMRQHINPKNDTAAKKIAQAQQCLKEAREKFHRRPRKRGQTRRQNRSGSRRHRDQPGAGRTSSRGNQNINNRHRRTRQSRPNHPDRSKISQGAQYRFKRYEKGRQPRRSQQQIRALANSRTNCSGRRTNRRWRKTNEPEKPRASQTRRRAQSFATHHLTFKDRPCDVLQRTKTRFQPR